MWRVRAVFVCSLVIVLSAAAFGQSVGRLGVEFQVNVYTIDGQLKPVVASDGAGAFVVAYEGVHEGESGGIFASSRGCRSRP